MRLHSSRNVVLVGFALALGLAGCASGGGGGGGGRPAGATGNRIVQEELVALGQLDALQAVQRLRAQWLRSRGGDAAVLYVDGTRRGAADELRFIRADEVMRMEFLSPNDATTRFGTGHTGGAILVTMARGR